MEVTPGVKPVGNDEDVELKRKTLEDKRIRKTFKNA